jgi:hypothetical protein
MKKMKNWIGNWMIGTSILHTVFAIVMFQDIWKIIIDKGIFNCVGEDAQIAGVIFFLLWGLIFFSFGLTVRALEQNNIRLPNILAFGLIFNALTALVFVPESGFWLLFPPAIAILIRNK